MASTALASPALARDGQWYVELGGGPMIVEDVDFDLDNDLDDDDNSVDTFSVDADDYGYDFGGLVGYDFGAFRLEAEASFREVDVDTVTGGNLGVPTSFGRVGSGELDAAGDINSLSFMINGLFDFGPDDGLQGFAGGGVGVARTEVQGTADSRGSGFADDSDTGFAWQLLAGVRAPLTESIDAGLRYRFFNADSIGLVDPRGFGADADLRTHSLMGSLIFNFGGEEEAPYVAPPVAPVPAPVAPRPVAPTPPPAPVCNQGPYVVFFEWDESDITPEAATILDNAVSAYANCGMASVMLAGHTDTSGPADYNIGLSERRNDSVSNYLAGRGVPAARIATEAFGESQLRVPTANGVRELQNRRVQIMYGPGSGM